jgi:hypothetical protein
MKRTKVRYHKNNIVPVTPDSPATNYENLPEDNRIEVKSCHENHVLKVQGQIPVNT